MPRAELVSRGWPEKSIMGLAPAAAKTLMGLAAVPLLVSFWVVDQEYVPDLTQMVSPEVHLACAPARVARGWDSLPAAASEPPGAIHRSLGPAAVVPPPAPVAPPAPIVPPVPGEPPVALLPPVPVTPPEVEAPPVALVPPVAVAPPDAMEPPEDMVPP